MSEFKYSKIFEPKACTCYLDAYLWGAYHIRQAVDMVFSHRDVSDSMVLYVGRDGV